MQEALLFPMEHDYRVVCGLDEAGRGPLAGPVVAGAVILGPDFPTHRRRQKTSMRGPGKPALLFTG